MWRISVPDFFSPGPLGPCLSLYYFLFFGYRNTIQPEDAYGQYIGQQRNNNQHNNYNYNRCIRWCGGDVVHTGTFVCRLPPQRPNQQAPSTNQSIRERGLGTQSSTTTSRKNTPDHVCFSFFHSLPSIGTRLFGVYNMLYYTFVRNKVRQFLFSLEFSCSYICKYSTAVRRINSSTKDSESPLTSHIIILLY